MNATERTRDFGMFFESVETEKKKPLKKRREAGIERAHFGFELLGNGSCDVPRPALATGVDVTSHRLLEQNFGNLYGIAIAYARTTQ